MTKPLRPAKTPDDFYKNRHEKTDNGGIKVVEKGMKHAIKTPCAECPFRRDAAPGYLGGYSPEMYMDIVFSPASIACHLSKGFGDINRIDEQRHCTGVSAFRANTGYIANIHGYPTAAHDSTQIVGHNEEVFFASPQEFCDHHGPAQIDTTKTKS
jgi:hypothetical protein